MKHTNFDTQPSNIENEISRSFAEKFYVDGQYKIIEDIVLLLNCSFDKVEQNLDFKTITTKSGEKIKRMLGGFMRNRKCTPNCFI